MSIEHEGDTRQKKKSQTGGEFAMRLMRVAGTLAAVAEQAVENAEKPCLGIYK